ncbi:CAZyme family GH16 [Agaricus bisporus var. burnettii]|nr:CAZyme family GH16 [Agaricus bisporus var. burnettii]
MPTGDWLWPAIWMLPKDEVYGPWPLSGEIDILESRGNNIRYTARGSNYVQGSLNWGPTQILNGVSKSYSWWQERRKSFGSEFRTYALEWTDKWLRIYVDNRLHTLLDIKFDKPFFERGEFPEVIFDGPNPVALKNPWINGTNVTPFDQEFYLILNVAVGGTNGWFPDVQGDKPWLDASQNAMRDFALAQSQWYPTWPTNVEDRAMVVDYVKMWKHCDGN